MSLQLPAEPPPAPAASTEQVAELLARAAILDTFSISVPDRPDTPIPPPGGSADPQALIGIRVTEAPHRFRVRVEPPRGGKGLRARNVVGREHALLTLDWMLTPDDYVSLPDRQPPPTLLDPQRSQRFTMLNGRLSFDAEGRNGFHGFGCGRTFPMLVDGAPQIAIGANADILDGWGLFAGVQGSYVINGYIAPPHGLFLQFVFRFVDLDGRFRARSDLKPLEPIADPLPGSTYLTLLGEADPERPPEQHFAGSRLVGVTVHEILRTVDLDFDQGRHGDGLRAKRSAGPIVGRMTTGLNIDPFNPATPGTPLSPVPFFTSETEIAFFGSGGAPAGTLQANIVEGRGFRMELPGAPLSYRLVGFGPLLGGTGELSGVQGMLSVNSAISLQPASLFNVYSIRLIDPTGRFRARTGRSG